MLCYNIIILKLFFHNLHGSKHNLLPFYYEEKNMQVMLAKEQTQEIQHMIGELIKRKSRMLEKFLELIALLNKNKLVVILEFQTIP